MSMEGHSGQDSIANEGKWLAIQVCPVSPPVLKGLHGCLQDQQTRLDTVRDEENHSHMPVWCYCFHSFH